MMQLATDAGICLRSPHLVRAQALESCGGGLDGAREHETDGLEQRHRARFQPAVLDSYSRLADVSRDEVDALHLGDGYAERLGDGRLNEALAQADAHLARDDLDHEACGLRMKAPQQVFEWRCLGRPAGCADRLQGRLDIFERGVLILRASFERLAGPVAEVGVLLEDSL